ncbi:MAG: hypothetical protein WD749_06915 [Phycisphaerales bacterium]
MAKLFYTLDEAAGKLKKSPDEIKEMVTSGQLQEFRDRDKLMFKVDQVNLLAAGGEDESSIIPLAESGEMATISLASDSGTGMNLESPKEQTGISIFDADQTEEADPSAVTQVTEAAPTELSLETVGSGSGLLDLTREADDTSLGQDLLEEVSAREGSTANATQVEEESVALFEGAPAEAEAATAPTALVVADSYDGTWSGVAGGVAFGMVLVLAFTVALTIFGISNSASLAMQVGQNFWVFVGAAAGLVFIAAIVGMLIGKRS